MIARPVKRSVKVAGHATSVSLEAEFWQALRDIAGERGMALSALIEEVDRERGAASLSGALRVHALKHARARAGAAITRGR